MKKTSTFLILVSFLIFSCDNFQTKNDNVIQVDSTNNEAVVEKLNDVLKKHETPSQMFKIAADKPSIVKGKKGTKIQVNPEDFITESGKPLGKNIKVELKELLNQNQLLTSNAQTVSDGKLLISGGAYFIGMTSNGEKLKLKDGKTLSVNFPKITDKKMTVFYGQKDDLGQMNWQGTSQAFKSSQKPTTESNGSYKIVVTRASDFDALTEYLDSGYVETPQQKQENLKREKDKVVDQKVYDEIGINKLGYINCDRFLDEQNLTNLYATFNPSDSIINANIYLVFKSINSVMHCYSSKNPKFQNIPVGYKARLIAYTVKNEKVFAYYSDLTITDGQQLALDLKEINEKDFKKLINN